MIFTGGILLSPLSTGHARLPEPHDYRLGIDEIDVQHQNLFRIANRLNADLAPGQLYEELMNLYRYTREHFTAEEALMRKWQYPDYLDHKRLHDQLLGTLNTTAAEVAREPEKLPQLQAFLANWVVGHIQDQDQRIADFLDRAPNRENTE